MKTGKQYVRHNEKLQIVQDGMSVDCSKAQKAGLYDKEAVRGLIRTQLKRR